MYPDYFKSSAFGDVKVLRNGRSGGSFTGGPPKFVIHTTEGGGLPSYQDGATAPHTTFRFLGTSGDCEIYSHTPMNVAARSLRNLDGGVQTNRDSVVQMEIIGSCVNSIAVKYGILFIPGINDAMKRTLAGVIKEQCILNGIPVRPLPSNKWIPYDGRDHGQRMSYSEWDNFSGICGHEHVPENNHLDPAELDLTTYFDLKPIPPKPVPVPIHAPMFPLPKGHYFGIGRRGHTGFDSATDRNNLRIWQNRMRVRGWTIGVDGLYGSETDKVATNFQKEKRFKPVDGLIGPDTWTAAWTKPIT
jgi:hypothetical protein